MNKIKQHKNLRSSSSWVTWLPSTSAWSCPAMAWQQCYFTLAAPGCASPIYKLLWKLPYNSLRHIVCTFWHLVMQRFSEAALRVTLGLSWKTAPWGESSPSVEVDCTPVIPFLNPNNLQRSRNWTHRIFTETLWCLKYLWDTGCAYDIALLCVLSTLHPKTCPTVKQYTVCAIWSPICKYTQGGKGIRNTLSFLVYW